MYMVVFALMSVVSGWVAWRKNPMFSARSTLRFLFAVGLMLAAIIGAIIQAVNFASDHPGPLGFIVLGAVILLGTLAMIWVIVAVSTPKSAPLPPSVTVVHVYRGKLRVWDKRYAVFLLALAVLEFVLPQTPRIAVGVVGGVFAFLGIVLLFAGYLSARQMDLWLSAVEADPWVHWHYSAEQWKQWTEVEVARTPAVPTFLWRRDWAKFVWLILAIGIAVGLFSPGPILYRGLYVAGVAALLLLLVELSQKSEKHAPQRMRSLLSQAAPEMYFGQEGVFCDGIFTPWLTTGVYLLGAWVDNSMPRSVVLRFEKIVTGNTGNQPTTVDFSMPLPDGFDVSNDLARLQKELSARCPTATVNLA